MRYYNTTSNQDTILESAESSVKEVITGLLEIIEEMDGMITNLKEENEKLTERITALENK